ncbi:MAG: bifunctional demethylmenaquinone methyltransferase/2-methoxy-6-polyprenyl-1,4-benzoquinol methylase UbiE [Proteobacteria bacterium]|nr:bifunctional demethylmenaquinone methyltransferase/2-methoxy-6-polyprenyl-1,4-benzoquinol methylase UbiE [Pseudomonadota bacterium]
MMGDDNRSEAWFGFQRVAAADKGSRVRQVFDSVAERYDLMNDLMSGGVHRLWKAALVDWLAPRGALRLLDMAGGTGDVALRVAAQAPQAAVVVADANARMLSVGRDRAINRGIIAGLEYLTCDAEALPLRARTFDAYTIAFGLRNVTRIDVALGEAHRVLKPGGRFLCLEFSRVVVPGLAQLYDAYSFRVLPEIGARVARDRAAYQYLVESIRRFPPQDELARLMTDAGFAQVSYRNLSGGIAAIHSGWRV